MTIPPLLPHIYLFKQQVLFHICLIKLTHVNDLASHLSAVEFPTNSLEMNAVANIFDMNSDGFIDYYEFVSALHPSRDPYRKALDADQINEEVRASCARQNTHECSLIFPPDTHSDTRYFVSFRWVDRYHSVTVPRGSKWSKSVPIDTGWVILTKNKKMPMQLLHLVLWFQMATQEKKTHFALCFLSSCCSLGIPSSCGWFVSFAARWWSGWEEAGLL